MASIYFVFVDKQFWPSEVAVHTIFKKMSESGTIQRGELYQIWKQDTFSKVFPHRKYIFDMLIHLDIVSEQRRYNTKTGRRLPAKNFFVPCMVTERNTTNFMSNECTPNRAISLAFTFKGAIIPPALPNRLISACLSMWNVKTYKEQKENGTTREKRDVKLLFSGFLCLSYDKAHDVVVCVEANRIHIYIVHKTSSGLIVSDIATNIKETFCTTLERIIEFYQSTVNDGSSSSRKPFQIEYSCLKLECFITEKEALQRADWICEKHKLTHERAHWNVWNQDEAKKQCKEPCSGLSEDALNQIPSDIELLRFSSHSPKDMRQFAEHLGVEDDWETIESDYPQKTAFSKFLILIRWKEAYPKGNFRNLADALNKMNISAHKLCCVKRAKKVDTDLPDDILECIPTDEILDSVASTIGQKFFQLGTELGLSVADLENIQEEQPGKLAVQNKEILHKWRKDEKLKATMWVLMQALVNIGRGLKSLEDFIEDVDFETLRTTEDVTDRIADYQNEIIEELVISDILDDMMTHLVISADDRRRIEQHAGQDDQNKALVDLVMKRREPMYTVFVGALKKNGYPELANNLKYESQDVSSSSISPSTEKKGLSVVTNQHYKVRLQKNYSRIVSDIKHEHIVDHLITRDVLSIDDRQKIEAGQSQKGKEQEIFGQPSA
ncbi:unnamed protein product [Mytilus coruscus]|uniref:Death domain-containing protein n=1 Tax=Mytilus coruscus TaxID=42192 RepID=A0A6J8D3K2_MYTCO|nr:unnamed protein product [Mytilus coruscus]